MVISTDRAHALVKANAALRDALAANPLDRARVSALQADAYNMSQNSIATHLLEASVIGRSPIDLRGIVHSEA